MIMGERSNPEVLSILVFMTGQLTAPRATYPPPPRNKGLINGLIKGSPWVFISTRLAIFFWGGVRDRAGLFDDRHSIS